VELSPIATPPPTHPLLGFLVGGFVILVAAIALLTARRGTPGPIATAESTRRALVVAALYGLFSSCFMRIITPALLGREHSPWLLALGDVLAVTVGLFAWSVLLVEPHRWRDYGLRPTTPARLALTLGLAGAAALLLSWRGYADVLHGHVRVTPDSLAFALFFSVLGSAFPEELLFRGWLQGSLEGRVNRWAQLVFPALAFTAVRSIRYLPGADLSVSDWLADIFGTVLPLGLWWGLMRDLAGGSIWPCIVSHTVLELGNALAGESPRSFPGP
jgi:membrane protease YdiL (CAAX protease family)